MSTIVVRYRPSPDQADENQALVESVFSELASKDPGGVRYATFRLEDGTFVHIADVEGDDNPLPNLDSFKAFQAGLADRCADGDGPNPQPATLVGNYRLLGD